MTRQHTPHSLATHGITVQARSRKKRAKRPILSSIAFMLLPLVIVTALWQLWTTVSPSPFFPTPVKIAANLWELLTTSGAESGLTDLIATVSRMAIGFAVGSAFGVVVGAIMGLRRTVRDTLNPIVEFLRSIPATATLPLFIILVGAGDDMRIAFIAYGVSWFVLINTAQGVGSIHKTLFDMGEVFRVSWSRRFFTIILPGAMPKIFAGLRIASTAALLLAIVSEFMLATDGVGFLLIQAQGRFQLVDMWSWMLALAILGLAINLLLDAIEHKLLAWHRLSRAKI